MTNRTNTDSNQDLMIPLDEPTGDNNRRGVQVSFPRDITDEEICKVLKACGWWEVPFGRRLVPQCLVPQGTVEITVEHSEDCLCGNSQVAVDGLCYDCIC